MDQSMNKDQPVRRPLPDVPVSVNVAPQRPNTPVHGASSTPIPVNSFYSAASQPPPLPLRPKKPGSANTSANLTAMQSAPPYTTSYHNDIGLNGFREPELVTDEDKMPELLPMQTMNEWETSTQWDWNDPNRGWSGTGDWATDDNTGFRSSSVYTKPVTIDGWDAEEERLWWDPAVRDQRRRPGPGILPPLLAEKMHNPDHTLYSVSVKPPDYKPIEPPATQVKADGRVETSTPSSSPPPVHRSSSTAPSPPQPTEDDVRTSVPHPNAYYCPKDNGWVILQWKSSAVLPPLASSFSWPHPLPDQDRRKATVSCVREQEGGNTNKTHHFHYYPRAIDSLKLTPPFRHTPWQVEESIKQKRRAASIPGDIDMGSVSGSAAEELPSNPEEEGELLDLYMCCQCSLYCVSSSVIPGVIPRKYFDEFIKEKKASPPPGKSPEISIGNALDTIIMVIENRLWKGENRMLRVTRPSFTTKLGWSAVTKKVFATLGFIDELLPGEESEPALRPPATDVVSQQGRENRTKLLRAWVELSAWVAIFRRINAPTLKDHRCFPLSVTVDSAREMYQTAIGAHPDQITRGNMPDTLQPIMQSLPWDVLGMTMTSYSPELLMFAYFAQCRCDPSGTVTSFTQLAKIATIMEENHMCPPELQDLFMNERSHRQRFTESDVLEAAGALGFGSDGPLKVDFDNDIPSEFIENAWKDCIQRSWIDPRGSQVQTAATEALRILAEARGDQQLHRLWEDKKDRLMDPAKAYSTIEVPNDVEDAMLITIYGIRLDEQPSQAEKMREALTVIAEIRGSERLRRYLETGSDPGEIVAPTRPDIPRGLNQLGNTCYLNSLLQYFYTIRDLRDTVIQMGQLYSKTLEEDKLTDDDLKQHRVGGRLVTRREVFRSKKFIKQLADLFVDMECSEAPSVTPTIELAKLALVTSRDEEEDEADKGGTESSNDTDATLVEDGPSRFMSEPPPRSPSPSPSSILGKRTRGSNMAMDVDSPSSSSTSPIDADKERFVTPPSRRSSSVAGEASGSSARSPVDRDGDVMMAGPHTTALANKKSEPTSDSTMMFGKQHDVAECMDNCIFQIETALLKFGALSGPQEEKTSIVKRLFYGKMRQRVSVAADAPSTIHEKEDLFSHLPVNVVHDGVDIYDGLSGYFDDSVEFEGKKARMEVSLVELPPLLQIQLQRVQFNRETLQPYKSQAYVKFGETIYMDRFLESANPQKKSRSKQIQAELNASRERIRSLLYENNGSCSSSIEKTSTFLSDLQTSGIPGIDEELLQDLRDEPAIVNAEVDELRSRSDILKDQLEDIWRDDTQVAYELTSVFIHRGSSPSWGHYFFYSRHLPDQPDCWFKYNDSDVTEVSKDEVLADTTGSTANPYLLVFARKGSEVVHTVKRSFKLNEDLS